VSKKDTIKRINHFYRYLKARRKECLQKKEISSVDLGQFQATNIITDFYEGEFFKVLKKEGT